MSQSNKKNPSEDLMESLMAELKLVDGGDESLEANDKTTLSSTEESSSIEGLELGEETDFGLLDLNFEPTTVSSSSALADNGFEIKLVENETHENIIPDPEPEPVAEELPPANDFGYEIDQLLSADNSDSSEKTVALTVVPTLNDENYSEDDRTVAVAGYSNRNHQKQDEDVKISVGQSGNSGGYSGWGSTDSHLAQVENLKIAQSKILDLEKDNEKLRHQNEELISASEIIKERSDLLTAQVYEYKNDREGLENSFKNEMALLKSQLNRKDAELQKAQMKIDELDSRLKFDMKKIRIRERELENRLELTRAEKNALVRSKDEQILEARRKIDQLQLEVDSYRQKCVELNRALESNQDSFKRTMRALRLATANLELQEENKTPLKKVD